MNPGPALQEGVPDTRDSLSALQQACEQLRLENEQLRRALEEMPHGLCMFDSQDRLLLANSHYLELWGLPASLGRPGTRFADIMAATPGRETEASRQQPPPAGGGTRQREWQLNDGRVIAVSVARRADGSCVALHSDVTEQRRMVEQIAHLARHDSLTGLPNRSVLLDTLRASLLQAAPGQEVALLCLDLDRFKPVNDSLGHAAGDSLLQEVATRLRGCLRSSDLVARLGGDEFAVLQGTAPQPASATALGQRVIRELERGFDLSGRLVHIGVSVGIAVAPRDGRDEQRLLKCADLALYRAKAGGRGTLRRFDPALDSAA